MIVKIIVMSKISLKNVFNSLLIFFLLTAIVNAQTKDVSKMSSSTKKKELVESLDWLKTKIGTAFPSTISGNLKPDYKEGDIYGMNIYSTLEYDSENPTNIKVNMYDVSKNQIVSVYNLNLSDIYDYEIWYSTGPAGTTNYVTLKTFENQRLIKRQVNEDLFIASQLPICYDSALSKERLTKALDYIIKLSGGGKKKLKEKF